MCNLEIKVFVTCKEVWCLPMGKVTRSVIKNVVFNLLKLEYIFE